MNDKIKDLPGLVYPLKVCITIVFDFSGDNCSISENRPFPSYKKSHFQNEAKCETFVVKMSFICITIKIIFVSMASHLASF